MFVGFNCAVFFPFHDFYHLIHLDSSSPTEHNCSEKNKKEKDTSHSYWIADTMLCQRSLWNEVVGELDPSSLYDTLK